MFAPRNRILDTVVNWQLMTITIKMINITRVIAPNGWPLTLAQWSKVNEVRNMHEEDKLDTSMIPKKAGTKDIFKVSKNSMSEG